MKLHLTSVLGLLTILVATSSTSSHAETRVFIDADSQFSAALAAAIERKHVPVTVVLDPKHADYTLKSAPVDSKDESGAGKIARCLFADCIGMNGNSSVSVELRSISRFRCGVGLPSPKGQ